MHSISRIKFFFAILTCLIISIRSSRISFESIRNSGKCTGHVLKSFQASPFSCMSRCKMESNCSVINHNEELGTCELISYNSSFPLETKEFSGWSCSKAPDVEFCSTAKHSEIEFLCCVLGTSRCVPARSCLHLTTTCPSYVFESGLYWIQGPLNAIQMYCDMETYGGGWTKVANVNTTLGSYPDPSSYLSDDIRLLDRASSGFFRLSTKGLMDLRGIIEFTQLRIFCFKPSRNRKVHIVTKKSALGSAVVDYMAGRINTRPVACNSYTALSDDTSYLSKNCNQWYEGMWGDPNSSWNDRIYRQAVVILYKSHIIPGNFQGRYECDDYLGSSQGIWTYFVR